MFKIDLLCFLNKLSLISNLNLLESIAEMLKSSKFMAQLHCNRWSDIADCLTFFSRFPVRLGIHMWDKVFTSGLSKFSKGCLPHNLLSPLLNTLSHMFNRSSIKVMKSFSIMSNLALTTV